MTRMPRTREEFEDYMVYAFMLGMNCGYAVEHTELGDEEDIYRERFTVYIQGKIDSVSVPYNNRLTFTERLAECGISNE